MAQKIQVRRGTAAQLAADTLDLGEPGFTSDGKQLYVGDGVTEPGNLIGPATSFILDLATQNLSAGVASAALFAVTVFVQLFAKFVLAAGSGAYVVNEVLPVAGITPGALAFVNIELPASTNPTINFYDTSTGGTLLKSITTPNAGAAAAYAFLVFKFGQDGHWHLIISGWN